jgi:hypothetical protein
MIEPGQVLLHEGALFAEFVEAVGHGIGGMLCPLKPALGRT